MLIICSIFQEEEEEEEEDDDEEDDKQEGTGEKTRFVWIILCHIMLCQTKGVTSVSCTNQQP